MELLSSYHLWSAPEDLDENGAYHVAFPWTTLGVSG